MGISILAGHKQLRAASYEQPEKQKATSAFLQLVARSSKLSYISLCAKPGTVFTMSLKITMTANNTMKTNAAW